MTSFSAADYSFMVRAIQLAQRGKYTTHPNPNVGCVIVRDGMTVGEGWHQRAGEGHAEVSALAMAGEHAAGADVYVSLEPCSHFGRTPPCAEALVAAGVKRVFVAMEDPNPQVAGRGLERLQQAGIETFSGLLQQDAEALNPGFLSAMRCKRPFVRVKMATSLDGRTAMASGESVWITGKAARRDVQFWRAQAGAILTGIDTVLMDTPSMNVRLSAEELQIPGAVRQPLRVILDSQLRCPLDAPLLALDGEVLIYTCSDNLDKMEQLQQQGVKVRQLAVDASDGVRLDLSEVLPALHAEGINEVHVEAGATLSGAFVEQGLADELLIYMAPVLMGSDARALFNMPLQQMAGRLKLDIFDTRAIGNDWRIRAKFLQE